jgi:ADP-ribose pyrophosphatase YjhB (NUDIX family)
MNQFKSQLKNRSGQILDYTYSDSLDFSELKDIKVKGVHAFCFYGDKMVVVWSDKKNYWTPPGGGIEEGESIEEAVIREVQEETNMKVLKQVPIGFVQINEPQGLITQARSFCLVEPYGDFVSDPDGDIDKIELIDPKDYKKYFDWGEGGEYLMKRALEILKGLQKEE